MPRLMFLFSFLPMIMGQYNPYSRQKESRVFLQQINEPRGPTNLQYSSIGPNADSSENNQVSPGQFFRNSLGVYQNGIDGKFQESWFLEENRKNYKFQEANSLEETPGEENLQGARTFNERQRNDKFQKIRYPEELQRNEKFQRPREFEEKTNNIRYQGGFSDIGARDQRRPGRFAKSWYPSRPEDHRGRQRRPRISSSRREAHKARENFLADGKSSVIAEIKRNSKIVKYIADKNGFAVREDLIKPLQNSIDRTRLESQRRIVTASAGPHHGSQVVTSAIRVAGQSLGNTDGKFLPQIFDLRVGKRPKHTDIDQLAYSIGAREVII